MGFEIRRLTRDEFPYLLTEIPDSPTTLYVRGELPSKKSKCLVVVGSRNYTDYGKNVTTSLISGLRGYDVAIISGLALGIDAIAHQAALDTKLYTLAVPGSGIADEALYPRRHKNLAHEILEAGGGLLSEFEPTFRATQWSFPQRNRIMAGLAHAVLVIEATEKSGTLITSRLATDYNRDVCAVPGSIYSESSKGPHMLIRLGATPITSSEDLREALHLEPQAAEHVLSNELTTAERVIYMLLNTPVQRDELIRMSKIPTQEANSILMHMEIKGYIVDTFGIISKQ